MSERASKPREEKQRRRKEVKVGKVRSARRSYGEIKSDLALNPGGESFQVSLYIYRFDTSFDLFFGVSCGTSIYES